MPEKKEDTLPEPTTDIRPEEMKMLMAYIEAGLPDIGTMENKVSLKRAYDYYADGHSYASVARSMKTKREIILYFAHKFNWYQQKRDYLQDLADSLQHQRVIAKLAAEESTYKLFSYYKAKFGDKVSNWLANNNKEEISGIDPREVNTYLRILEIFRTDPSSPLLKDHAVKIGINVGHGIDVKSTGPNSMELTPKEKSSADFLAKFAQYEQEQQDKREKEKLDSYDIPVDNDEKDE